MVLHHAVLLVRVNVVGDSRAQVLAAALCARDNQLVVYLVHFLFPFKDFVWKTSFL